MTPGIVGYVRERVHGLIGRFRRYPTRAELEFDNAALSLEIDKLWELRDGLRGRITALEQAVADLREVNRSAYERTKPGTECRKVRYVHQEDADQHAIWAATRHPGESFRSYRCGSCRAFPATGTAPYHVGHSNPGKKGAVRVVGGVVHYGCGCRFSPLLDRFVWSCREHAD